MHKTLAADIRPIWVVVNGVLKNVSDFAELTPQKRPEAFCPLCQRLVTLKLGKQRAHHYAHQPEDYCASSNPETALHLNTKFYIYTQLLTAQKIYLEEKCLNHYCKNSYKNLWLQNWDKVEIEFYTDNYKPDIAILSNYKVVAAIEVVVTHPVDEVKAEYFKKNNISWVEIDGDESIYSGDNPWTPEQPLYGCRLFPTKRGRMCQACKAEQERLAAQAEREKLAAQAERERLAAQAEYSRLNYTEILAAKLVDVYFSSGKKYREMLFLEKIVEKGICVKMRVRTEKNSIIAFETGNSLDYVETIRKLNQILDRKWIEYTNKGAMVDKSMKWRKWVTGQKFVARDTGKFPFRYEWDYYSEKWILLVNV